MCHNARALALYQQMGFMIEGTLRDTLKIDGCYIDEYQMSKVLVEDGGAPGLPPPGVPRRREA